MGPYAVNKSVGDAVNGGGLLVVAQWEAKEGQADEVAEILNRFLPEAQREPGAKLFLIARAKENPAQFLFYELFRDEAAFKAHSGKRAFQDLYRGPSVAAACQARARAIRVAVGERHLCAIVRHRVGAQHRPVAACDNRRRMTAGI